MSSRIHDSNVNSNEIYDAVTSDDPPRAASPGITLAQSGGYHGNSSDHVKGPKDPQAPLIVNTLQGLIAAIRIKLTTWRP